MEQRVSWLCRYSEKPIVPVTCVLRCLMAQFQPLLMDTAIVNCLAKTYQRRLIHILVGPVTLYIRRVPNCSRFS